MSETPAAQEKVQAPAKTRSPLERLVVWGGIILLGVVVFVEYSGQKNYNAAMTWFEENEYKGKSLADVRTAAVGASESDVELSDSKKSFSKDAGSLDADMPKEVGKSFRWMSLFKNYELVATFQGEGDAAKLTGFYNPELLKEVEQEMAAKFVEEGSKEMPPEGSMMDAPSPGAGGSGSSEESEPAGEKDSAADTEADGNDGSEESPGEQ